MGMKPDDQHYCLTQPFLYDELQPNHIRLLTFLDSNGTPSTRLQDFADDNLPIFNALSYSWGKGPLDANILCNGRYVPLTEHLSAAFRAVHRAEPTARLWVDAVCTNQTKNAEKNVQLKKMATIFGKAHKVLVWLGGSHDNSDLLLDEAKLARIIHKMFQTPRRLSRDESIGEDLPGRDDPFWRAMDMLCRRDWFSRLWVVEEIALSQRIEVLCGKKRVPFDLLLDVAKGMYHLGMINLSYSALAEGLEGGSSVIRVIYLDEIRHSSQWITLLQMIRQKQVSKRVDRIYGILSLVDEGARNSINVNYNHEQNDYWFPYIEFASYVVERDPTLSILSMASSRERPAGLPSWCPNFNSAQPAINYFGGSSLNYRAGFISRNERRSSILVMRNADHHIKVPGFRVDKVEKVVDLKFSLSPDFSSNTGSAIETATLLEWEEMCLQLSMEAYASKEVPDAHWRTLIGDTICQLSSEGVLEESYPAPDSFKSVYEDRKQWWLDKRANRTGNVQLNQESLQQFMTSVSRCQERTFFKTRDNRVGCGPSNTQPGDLICGFYSAAPLFILRFERSGFLRKLVGDAYVHGLMSLQTTRQQGLEAAEDFVLS